MIPMLPQPVSDAPWYTRTANGLRHPVRWLDALTGTGPIRPLVILFGLNAIDEVARISFSVTAPTIADDFGVGIAGVTIPFVLAFGAALALSVPIANVADRGNRVRIALLGGLVFAGFSALVGLSVSIWMVAFMLAGSQIGKAFIEPSHTSLLSDYYEVGLRPRIFSFYRAGNAVGALVGGITAGYIAEAFSWRVPFFVYAIPTALLVLAGATLPEPRRGVQEKKLIGADTATAETEEPPPSLAEAWRMCWQIDSLRRIYRVLPFLTPAIAGFAIFSTFLYRDVFGVDDSGRGWIIGLVEGPAQLVGLTVGARLGMRMFAKDPKLIFRLLSRSIFIVTGTMLVFALGARRVGRDLGQPRHQRVPRVRAAGHLRGVVDRDPAARAIDRLRDGLGVRARRHPHDSVRLDHRRHVGHALGPHDHGPGVPLRRPRDGQRRRPHHARHHPGLEGGRGARRGAQRPQARPRQDAPRAGA